MDTSILKVYFPPGFPFRTKLVKVNNAPDKTIQQTLEEILSSNGLDEDPSEYLWYTPEKNENETFTPGSWGKPQETLGQHTLSQKTIVHLLKRKQVNRVKHGKQLKTVLLDYAAPLGEGMPMIAKKFNRDNWDDFHLYISGETEPLKLDQSLVSQDVLPGAVFALRKLREPVDHPMYPLKQRITISLNQKAPQAGKRNSFYSQSSQPPPEEVIPAKTVKLNSAAKSFTKPVIKGWLTNLKDAKGKWEKRYCVIESDHLFYYKTVNDIKPLGVLPLRDYFFRAKTDEKRKLYYWHLISLARDKTGPDGRPMRTVHTWKVDTEKERKEWSDVLLKLTTEPPELAGPRPSPPPLVKGKPGKLFGRPLEQAVENPDGSQIPAIVFRCIFYLEKEQSLTREGIFRLSGSSNLIERYVQRIDKGEDVDLSQEMDPHAVAGLLKLYFRDLPEPLMTFELYHWFIASISTQDRALRLRFLKHLVNKLPALNKSVLSYLLSFLLKVAAYAEVNKMALHNLATVFAPNLLRPQQSNALGMVTDTPKINGVVNTLLQDYEYVFEDKEISFNLTDEDKSAPCCRALYDYSAQAPDELSFKKGSIIKIVHERSDGWWIGEFGNNNFGRVPATYVQKLSQKQSQEFNSRQKFKRQQKKLLTEKEEQERELHDLTEQRNGLLDDINTMQAEHKKLISEFYNLKECLTPILAKVAKIPDEDEQIVGYRQDNGEEEAEPEASPKSGKDKKEKKEKKEKKSKKTGKDKDSRKNALETINVPTLDSGTSSSVSQPKKDLPLTDLPKYVDEFVKESENHRKALDGVGPTKDVFLTSLEMLAGALPIKKDKKKGDPLRHSIDNIKAKTKVEAFTRAELAERKDDLLRDLNELQLLLNLTIKRSWTSQELQAQKPTPNRTMQPTPPSRASPSIVPQVPRGAMIRRPPSSRPPMAPSWSPRGNNVTPGATASTE